MQVNSKLLTRCMAVGKAGISVLGWAGLCAAVGATAAGLYGVLFAALVVLIYGDTGRLASTGWSFALCGAVAGALTGGFARMIDPVGGR